MCWEKERLDIGEWWTAPSPLCSLPPGVGKTSWSVKFPHVPRLWFWCFQMMTPRPQRRWRMKFRWWSAQQQAGWAPPWPPSIASTATPMPTSCFTWLGSGTLCPEYGNMCAVDFGVFYFLFFFFLNQLVFLKNVHLFWSCWVFVAAHGLSVVAASRLRFAAAAPLGAGHRL